MNLLEMLLSNSSAIGQVAKQFDLPPGQTESVMGQLVPVLARALQKNTSGQGGLDSLTKALQRGNHGQYFDSPNTVTQATSIDDGNSILGHLLGNKDVSRGLAGHAAEQTGISSGLIKKMLPMVAALAMGALSKKSSQGGTGSFLAPAAAAGGGSLLNSFLDADKDGSIADDLLSMAGKMLTS